MVGVNVTIELPNGKNNNRGPIWPLDEFGQQTKAHVMDTRLDDGSTTGPKTWNTFSHAGTNVVKWTGQIASTNCQLEPNQVFDEMPVHVLQCEPKFLGSGGVIPRLEAIGPDTIKVFLDPAEMSAASTALDAAISDWNDALANAGVEVEFERVSVSCEFGPDCVTVGEDSIEPCGLALAGSEPDPDTGYHTGNLLLLVHDDWSTWTQESLQRTFAHELGHFLGLANYTAACGVNQAVMQPEFACSPTQTPGTEITINDVLPIEKTAYGAGPQASCGF